jgi:hypothetical protein
MVISPRQTCRPVILSAARAAQASQGKGLWHSEVAPPLGWDGGGSAIGVGIGIVEMRSVASQHFEGSELCRARGRWEQRSSFFLQIA